MDRDLLDKVIKLRDEIDITLLYVEDNEYVRSETLSLLEQFFDSIRVATNGLEGLEIFKKEKIDLIITDINMPVMNGLEMIKKIREIDRRVPVVVITAFSDHEYLMESIKIGVSGYILKPIDINQFLETLYRVMERIKIRKERDRALALLNQYKKIIDESATVTKTDLKGNITYANDSFCRISGYSREELIGKPHNIVRHPDMPKSVFRDLWDTIQSKRIWHGVVKNKTKDGRAVYMKATVAPILDEKGNITEYIAVRHDIADVMNPMKLLRDKVRELKDPILLMCKIEDYEDLESIYDINTLEEIESKFFSLTPHLFPSGCNFPYRYNLGSGEFAFLKEKNPDEHVNTFLEKIKHFKDNVRKTIINLDGYEYDIEVILSFATQRDYIIENARMGIKKAIKEGVDIVIADGLVQKTQQRARKNIETLKKIREALSSDRITLYFQPIFNNRTGRVEKFESLVRLIDADGNVIPPSDFLEVAKIGKYYKQITQVVVQRALEKIREANVEISVNLSAVDIEDEEVRNYILEKISENPAVSSLLVVELLESESIYSHSVVNNFIKRLKSYGVKIAIDDFGMGYSNFYRLLEYEPDYIKIDASLVKNIVTDKNSFNIVETIKSFADKQGYKTIAEFVSSREIFDAVVSLGIDYSQGYYIGKPSPDMEGFP